MAAESRAAELRREIAYHDHRYHVLDDPLIGDEEYDALLDELCALEREHPELATAGSPIGSWRAGWRRRDGHCDSEQCHLARHDGTSSIWS